MGVGVGVGRHPRPTSSYTARVRDEHDHDDGDDGVAAFQQHRTMLLGVAYRLLGSFADAEDVVQESWLRWSTVDRTTIQAPHRFLMTVVTRLAIDRMRLAHRHRETHVGPWLPEPVRTDGGEPLGPAETAAQRETLSLAVLRLLQRLSVPERAVFVLREAFELPFEEIGEILGLGEAHARQLYRRGRSHLGEDRDRFAVDPGRHRDLVERFLVAARTGQRDVLEGLLARDVTFWNDSGGKVSAALRPVFGAERVSRLVIGTLAKNDAVDFRIVELNGQHGLLIRLGARWQVCSFEVHDGLITGVQWMADPDKLEQVTATDF
ncbi:sigma-70 family RNA polymerase sigma factor [Streptomyces sp. SID5785]|nr:RNA polymerase sigma factor SigJ [Streptomyces sp. SID5785]MZD07678.1 sigma-70 family RNA polymerase sigma factor [Streptomyces sp. SID5785]